MIARKLFGVCLLTVMALSLCFALQGAFALTDIIESELLRANSEVEQAFNMVSSADEEGANVTGLFEQLNVATGLLAQAENSYRIGDLNKAVNFADQASSIAQQVIGQADEAKESAIAAGHKIFLATVASVAVGSFLLILGLFLGWRLFKQRYINNMLEAKPEVTSN
jgi:hypothetical protein